MSLNGNNHSNCKITIFVIDTFNNHISDVNFDIIPTTSITLQDKGIFGSSCIGGVNIDTASKKLDTIECSDELYPLASTKSGKNEPVGYLRIRLHIVRTKPSLKKKSTRALIDSEKSILKCVRNNDYDGLIELLGIVSVEEVNKPEDKTGNTPLHLACLESKVLDERILMALVEV